jgi:hypothetical protein
MSTRFRMAAAVLNVILLLTGCTLESDDQSAGEVEEGQAVQVVPLYETTNIILWDDPCTCTPTSTLLSGIAQDYCRLPGEGGTNASIGFELNAPKGTDSIASSSCAVSATFQLEDDTTGISPTGRGFLIINLRHEGVVTDADNYQISLDVTFRGETGGIETRNITFCEETRTPGGVFCAGGEPYSADDDFLVEFPYTFEAGRIYQVEISAFGVLSASSLQAAWGGEITFILNVTNVQVEF